MSAYIHFNYIFIVLCITFGPWIPWRPGRPGRPTGPGWPWSPKEPLGPFFPTDPWKHTVNFAYYIQQRLLSITVLRYHGASPPMLSFCTLLTSSTLENTNPFTQMLYYCNGLLLHQMRWKMNLTVSPFSPGRPIIPLSPWMPWSGRRTQQGNYYNDVNQYSYRQIPLEWNNEWNLWSWDSTFAHIPSLAWYSLKNIDLYLLFLRKCLYIWE